MLAFRPRPLSVRDRRFPSGRRARGGGTSSSGGRRTREPWRVRPTEQVVSELRWTRPRYELPGLDPATRQVGVPELGTRPIPYRPGGPPPGPGPTPPPVPPPVVPVQPVGSAITPDDIPGGPGGRRPAGARGAAVLEREARELGVEAASYREDAEVGRRINHVLRDVKARGFDLPNEIRIDAERCRQLAAADPEKREFILRYEVSGERTRLWVNPADRYWRDPQRTAQAMRELGHWSTSDPHHAIYHDLAHHLHHRADPARYAAVINEPPPDELIPEIRANLSQRAVLDSREFVAEVFVKLWRGEPVSEGIMGLYRKLGGPEP